MFPNFLFFLPSISFQVISRHEIPVRPGPKQGSSSHNNSHSHNNNNGHDSSASADNNNSGLLSADLRLSHPGISEEAVGGAEGLRQAIERFDREADELRREQQGQETNFSLVRNRGKNVFWLCLCVTFSSSAGSIKVFNKPCSIQFGIFSAKVGVVWSEHIMHAWRKKYNKAT